MKLTTTILGASGYSGAEMVRLCDAHPNIDVVCLSAGRGAGSSSDRLLPHVPWSDRFASMDEALERDHDVVFSCLPSGELASIAETIEAGVIVDLSDDHRMSDGWDYGLPELSGPAGPRIANPGCYPTATLLALVPFVRAGCIQGPAIVDALSGFSGAGRKADDHLLLATSAGDASAYGTTEHRHVPEMERGLLSFGGSSVAVSFTPHLIPIPRGLLVTARASLAGPLSDDGCLEILHDAYLASPFVRVTNDWPHVKAVAGSNSALVHARIDARNNLLVASCAIDNLGKGAAGQAVQNLNLHLGLDESAGLSAVGVWP